ncbi:MAG TPA: hypothetical protein VNE61_14245 [Ktedonobacteraceae bacterium]|nr:hypothetical protein [Ktedonobacteraceae bacterium]
MPEQTPLLPATPARAWYCRGCGLRIVAESGVCARCGYPLDSAEEQRLLVDVTKDLRNFAGAGGANLPAGAVLHLSAPTIRALRRAASFGGAERTVGWLIWRYQMRLAELHEPGREMIPPAELSRQPTVAPVVQRASPPVFAPPAPPTVYTNAPPTFAGPLPAQALPAPPTLRPNHVATLRPLVDSPAGLMVALGTFLILIAILALPFLRQFSSLAIGVTIGAQLFFAAMAAATHRSAHFREFSRMYAVFFAITVPLLVIDIITLYSGANISIIIAMAAFYAAVTYGAFAIYQRFSPFGYLSMISLVTAVIACVLAFPGGSSWVASATLLLALVGLASVQRIGGRVPSPLERLFDTTWAVLRPPARVTMLIIALLNAVVSVPLMAFAIMLDIVPSQTVTIDSPASLSTEVTLLLLLLWLCLYVRRIQWQQGHSFITLLSLLCLLSIIHALQLPPVFVDTGYALALISVAAFYDFIGRARPRFMHLYIRPGLFLDGLALFLIALTPLLVAPLVPTLAFTSMTVTFSPLAPPFPFAGSTLNMLVVFALGVSCLLSVGIVIRRARMPFALTGAFANANQWPWGLLLSGALFIWTYSAVVVWARANAFWCFFALTLLLTALAMLVRWKAGTRWSHPLDVLALGSAVLTLLVSQQWGHMELVLFALAIIFYAVLLVQRRSAWLFIPFIFALFGLPFLFQSDIRLMLAVSIFLPFVAAMLHRLSGMQVSSSFSFKISKERLNAAWEWEWPLVAYALICGASLIFNKGWSGVLYPWMQVQLSPAVGITAVALVWYGCAGLARSKGWLFLAVAFAHAALFFIFQQWWTLAAVTLSGALVGLVASRLAGKLWAFPWYATALPGAIMLGIRGTADSHLLAIWLLLGVAGLIVLVASLEKYSAGNWLAALFAAWSFGIAAQRQNTLFLFVAALSCASAAVVISALMSRERGITRLRSKAFLTYPLPAYALLLVAATSMGIGETLAPFSQFPVWAALLLVAIVIFLVMLIERVPEAVVLVAAFAAWAIARGGLESWQLVLAYSVFCAVIFLSQFVWRTLRPATRWLTPETLPRALALGGQTLVVLFAFASSVTPNQGAMVQAGVFSLLILTGLTAWFANMQPVWQRRFWSNYSAGLLLALAMMWELYALAGSTLPLEVLIIPPASYLSVTAPFLIRAKTIPGGQPGGYIAAVIGSLALLLPSYLASLGSQGALGAMPGALLAVLLLLGESLTLFLLGMMVRVRFFILGGAALVVAGAIRALFYAITSTGEPALLVWVALALSGMALLAGATFVTLSQHGSSIKQTP